MFFIKYLSSMGFDVTNDIFAANSWYFKNSLVRANYNDLSKGIRETTEYLELFCAKEFTQAVGNAQAAILIQSVVTGCYGAFEMGASAMYMIEEWSLLRASLTHFLLTVILLYPMAFFLRWWAPVPVTDNLVMLFFFVCVYVCIWLSQYFTLKRKVR